MPDPFREPKSGNYFMSFSYLGKRYKRSTGSEDLGAARRAQKIVDGRVAQLKAGLVAVPAGVPLAEFVFDGRTEPDAPEERHDLTRFVDGYLRESAPPAKAASTHRTERIHISHLRRFAEDRQVSEVDGLDRTFFEAYKRWRHEQGVRNVTINKELGTFRHMMNVAVKSGMVEKNPLDGVSWLKEENAFERFRIGEEIEAVVSQGGYSEEERSRIRRFRYLAPEEVQRLLELCQGSSLYAFVATAAYTGMRFSEILRLKWSDVDFESERILARGRKGSHRAQESPRYVPLHRQLSTVLQNHRESSARAAVFTETKDHYYYLLKKITDGTEFEGVRFHTFRHSFASNLAREGVDQRLIDRWMGHQTEAMRKRYQHLFPDKQQEAIEKLGF